MRRRLPPEPAQLPRFQGAATQYPMSLETPVSRHRARHRAMLVSLPNASSSDFLAKRMQRLIAGICAPHRNTGAGAMTAAYVRRPLRRALQRSFRQASRQPLCTLLTLRPCTATRRIALEPTASRSPSGFRTATHDFATPVSTAAARFAWLKGIEKICVMTSNDADFVR